MTDELREQLEQLRAIAPSLNKATDDANVIVAQVERYLADCSIGISSYVEVKNEEIGKDGDGNRVAKCHYLAYGRVGSEFRIHIRVTEEVENEVGRNNLYNPEWHILQAEQLAWSSVPRGLKLEAFGQLPALLKVLVKEAKSLMESVSKTTETMQQLLTALPVVSTMAGEETTATRTPWTDAEMRIMARNHVRRLNLMDEQLHGLMPGRSIGAIRATRGGLDQMDKKRSDAGLLSKRFREVLEEEQRLLERDTR